MLIDDIINEADPKEIKIIIPIISKYLLKLSAENYIILWHELEQSLQKARKH